MPRKRKSADATRTLPEPPWDEFRKLVENGVQSAYLMLRRRDATGRWQTLRPQAGYPVQDLADGKLGEFLVDRHGQGGIYYVEVLDEERHLHHLVPRFEMNVEGPRAGERLASRQDMARGGVSPVFGGSTMPRFNGPSAPNSFSPHDFMQNTPDAVALNWASKLEEEKRVLQDRIEKDRERHQQALDRERERVHQLEQQMREMEGKHRDAIAELRTDMMMRIKEQPPPRDYTGLIAAIVPVFTALIEAGSSRSRESMTAQQKSMELQMSSMQSFLAASSKKDDGGVGKLIELAMPLVIKIMDDKSPSKMADLFATLSESNMATISLATTALRDLMPEQSDDPLQQILMRGLEGVDNVVRAYADNKSSDRQQQLQLQSAPSNGARPPQQQQALSPQSTPQEIANVVYQGAPPEYRTSEWYQLFVTIHDQNVTAVTVAEQLSGYLDELYEQERLPPLLLSVFEGEPGVSPTAALREFFRNLPISTFNPQRMEAICRAFESTLAPVAAEPVETPSGFANSWHR